MNRLCLIIILFLYSTCAIAQNGKIYYRLHQERSLISDGFVILDANIDGDDDLFIRHGDQYDLQDYKLESYYKSFKCSFPFPFTIDPIPTSEMDSVYFLIAYVNTMTWQ